MNIFNKVSIKLSVIHKRLKLSGLLRRKRLARMCRKYRQSESDSLKQSKKFIEESNKRIIPTGRHRFLAEFCIGVALSKSGQIGKAVRLRGGKTTIYFRN